MRHSLFTTLSCITLASLALLMSCSKSGYNDTDSNATTVTTSSDGNATQDIDTMAVNATLMHATRSYKFAAGEDSCFLTMTANVEWPREIGDAHLAKLSDTLICAAFPDQKGLRVEEAMTGFLNNTRGIIEGSCRVVPGIEVPDTTPDAWSIISDVTRTALTRKYVTYKVTTMSYMGGAHPSTVVTPVSYDLSTGEVVTPSYLFKAGSDKAIIDAVSANLAAQLGCRPGKFTEAGLFNDSLTMPSGMSIDADGMLVFQYGQYEIGPYSMGIITVSVSPYQLLGILKPAGRTLLGV